MSKKEKGQGATLEQKPAGIYNEDERGRVVFPCKPGERESKYLGELLQFKCDQKM